MIGSLAGGCFGGRDMRLPIIDRHTVATDNTLSWGCFVTPLTSMGFVSPKTPKFAATDVPPHKVTEGGLWYV